MWHKSAGYVKTFLGINSMLYSAPPINGYYKVRAELEHPNCRTVISPVDLVILSADPVKPRWAF